MDHLLAIAFLQVERMNVFLVHGIFDSGKLFKYMSRFLREAGHTCYVPSLKPSDARKGIADLSQKLGDYIIESIGKEEEFVIVGFSMGCLVSRYYLQELSGVDKCLAFHAISGPHAGSRLAHFYFGKGVTEMRPGSTFLTELQKTESRLEHIPLYSYRTPYDLIILPPSSSYWGVAENFVSKAWLHRSMLWDKFVCNHIKETLAGMA